MRALRLSLLPLVATLAFAPLPAPAQNADITFLHINDVYELAPVRGKGGFAQLMTLIKAERAKNPNTAMTIGGDFLSPSLLSGLVKGEQMIAGFNEIGVDFTAFGNHEFDFGGEVLKTRLAESKFPWLGTNVLGPDGKPYAGSQAYGFKQFGDVKVGFFGLLTPETVTLSSPPKDVRFAPVKEIAAAAVKALREQGANMVVALTHLTIDEDRELVRTVPGIDLVLGGHDHEPITIYERNVLIHKSGYDAHYLGAIDIQVRTQDTPQGKRTSVTPSGWRLVGTMGVAADAQVAALVKKYDDRLQAELGQTIGTATTELDSRRDFIRTQETGLGNLFSDAIRDAVGADIAITNGGGIRGDKLYPAGTRLTRKDVFTELPFGNVTVLVELSGAQVKAALENGVSQVEQKGGRFPQVSGMTFVYDPARQAGDRVLEVKIGGKPLDANANYKLAANDFILTGGDGFGMLSKGKVLIDASAGKLAASQVMDYIQAKGTVAPAVEGRIVRK
jgi:5'-nucleotidase / UDP-sugar diphosphatase